ncbi:uncharacterized protein FPOAC1_013412 [Fusarium poae]|uniref:Tc1-like transposase DDE domain-containing protein n=1 Tax=Fusarium poae TaxID=36050 RepID=A0A1B8AAH4_FUSPO|nr:uncharacterized protein FPOAC1_013412 [Fusarium poae]KAG8664632.1 hypothetical protein FPOAC1_013412 [Fusarium poae]OBS17476.1 hypothetical protein FPOA_12108 [Fusarium poae]
MLTKFSTKKSDVFKFNGVSRWTVRRVLNSSTDRTFHNDPNKSETRGRKRKWTEDDIDAVEDLFEKEGFEGERLQPSEIPAAGVPDVHPSTTRRSLRIRKYNKRLAHIVEFIDERYAKRRKKWSEDTIYKRPLPECWDVIYFSDEVHFGYDDERQAYIYRKPGTRYEPYSLQEKKSPTKKDEKKLHAWAAVGIGYKSDLVFYEITSNNNGKMTQKVYEEQILEKHIRPLLNEGRTFILEEDGASGHGPGPKNRVRRWKEKHGLMYYHAGPPNG